MLGGDKPLTNASEAGVFGQVGSAQGGGYVRYGTGGGLAILGGIAYGTEDYANAKIDNAAMGAAALRYLASITGDWGLFAEGGGWYAPDADLKFKRQYANGAGVATDVGNTSGDLSYYYARAGVVVDVTPRDQFVVSGEIGRQELEIGGFAEAFDAGNPFNAVVSGGTDRMDVAKLGLRWSVLLGGGFDATLWANGAYGFNRQTDMITFVAGLGAFEAAIDSSVTWAEYGARLGYALTESITLDLMVNGISGKKDEVDTRVHGGLGLRYAF